MSALIKAREELKDRRSANDASQPPELRPLQSFPHSVEDHHRNLDELAGMPTPKADEVIARTKEMFTRGHAVSNFRVAFNSLDYNQRKIILAASRISPKEIFNGQEAYTLRFQDFDISNRSKICDGLQLLNDLASRFHRVGSLKDLRADLIH